MLRTGFKLHKGIVRVFAKHPIRIDDFLIRNIYYICLKIVIIYFSFIK